MKIFYCVSLLFLFFSCIAKSNKENTLQKAEVFSGHHGVVLPKLPEKIQFAGQTISLEDEDIRERLDREVLLNSYYQSSTIGIIKRANRFFPLIEKVLKEEKVHADFKYLAVIESNLQQAVSPAGAQGFWQFMPATAKIYNLEMSSEVDERLHIEKSTRAACMYLKDAKKYLGDWILATASYNRGMGGVKQDMAWQKTNHYFDTEQNSETGRYVFRLLAVKIILENAEAHGFFPKKMELYKPIKTNLVTISQTIPNLVDWSIQHGINLKILRKLNPWLISTKLTVRSGKKYFIQLPSKMSKLKPYSAY